MKPLLRTSALALALLLGPGLSSPVFSQETPPALVEDAAPATATDAPAPDPAMAAEEEEMSKAEKAGAEIYNNMPWQAEGTGKIGQYAEIKIEPGYRFLPKEHSAQWLKMTGNLPDSSMLGVYQAMDRSWTAVFQYDDSGHVKDDDKDSLNADKLLKIHKEQTLASNAERKRQGLGTMTVVDWSMKPRYNDQTNNLEWGLRLQVDGGETINHETKLLSREGYMNVILICAPEKLEEVMPKYQASLKSFSFVSGQKYAEYTQGDKLATYTITGLAAGAGVAGLAKLGLLGKFFGFFAKMGKMAFAVVAGVFIGIARLFGFVKNKRAARLGNDEV